MYCGIVLTKSTEDPSGIAFLDDDGSLAVDSAATNEDILDLLIEHRPDVVALNAPPERDRTTELREGEKELVEGGHAILPQGMRDRQVLERAVHLARQIEASGVGSEIIESDPDLVCRVLDIATDDDLADEEIDPEDITSSREFDAVLLAVVARMHADEETERHAMVVPEGATEQEEMERDRGEPEVERDERFL